MTILMSILGYLLKRRFLLQLHSLHVHSCRKYHVFVTMQTCVVVLNKIYLRDGFIFSRQCRSAVFPTVSGYTIITMLTTTHEWNNTPLKSLVLATNLSNAHNIPSQLLHLSTSINMQIESIGRPSLSTHNKQRYSYPTRL